MFSQKVNEVVHRLESMPKQGEAYTDQATKQYGWRNPIRQDTGALLFSLTLARSPRNVLEVGTAYGLSGMYIAAALHTGSRMDSIEFEPGVAKIAQENFDSAGLPVLVRAGNALHVLCQLAEAKESYDMIFLDAQKDQYLMYLDLMITYQMLRPGCLLLADNVLDRAKEVEPFMAHVKEHYKYTILNTECGLLVAQAR